MLVEEAVVTQVDRGWVGVEKVPLTGCTGCSQSACSSQTIAKSYSPKALPLRLETQLILQVGDHVLLGIEEASIVKGALIIYLLPLISLILFASFGQILFSSELISVLMGITGFVMVLYVLEKNKLLSGNQLHPVILQKIDSPS